MRLANAAQLEPDAGRVADAFAMLFSKSSGSFQVAGLKDLVKQLRQEF
jgi:hypothetical protein